MPIELKTIHENLLYVAKVTDVTGALEILRRDLATDTLESNILPAPAVAILQSRLHMLLQAVDSGDRAAQLALFSGLLLVHAGRDRMTVSVVDGSPTHVALNIGTLSATHYITIGIPHSTQVPVMQPEEEETAASPLGARVAQGFNPSDTNIMDGYNIGSLSITAASSALNTTDATGPLVEYTSGATSGSVASCRTAGGRIYSQFKPRFAALVKTGADIGTLRIFSGLVGTTDPTGGDAPAINGLYFRFSSVGGDVNWQAVVSHFSSGATVVDTGVAVAAGTAYRLEIDASIAGTVVFKINDVIVATITTNLPADGSLYFGSWLRTVEAVAKKIFLGAHVTDYQGVGTPS